MNPVECTNVVRRADDVEFTSNEEFGGPQQATPGTLSDARLRYALLAGGALLIAWGAFMVRNAISGLDAQLDSLQATFLLSPYML